VKPSQIVTTLGSYATAPSRRVSSPVEIDRRRGIELLDSSATLRGNHPGLATEHDAMKLATGIRIGLVAVTLLAQLALPVAHNRGSQASSRLGRVCGRGSPGTSDASTTSAHDPALCPICLALSLARSGVGRVLPDVVLQFTSAATAQLVEPAARCRARPSLATAPPRAPPILSLSFA